MGAAQLTIVLVFRQILVNLGESDRPLNPPSTIVAAIVLLINVVHVLHA